MESISRSTFRNDEGRDGFIEFMSSHCEITDSPDDRIKKSELISHYTAFCCSQEFPVISQICLGRYLSRVGVWRGAREGGKNGQRAVYLGLKYHPCGVITGQHSRDIIKKRIREPALNRIKKTPGYKGKEDLRRFLSQNYERTRDMDDMINTENVYLHYKQFCADNGCLVLSKHSVGSFLSRKMNVRSVKLTGVPNIRNRGKLRFAYAGLRLVINPMSCPASPLPQSELDVNQLDGEAEEIVVEVDVMSLLDLHSTSCCPSSPQQEPVMSCPASPQLPDLSFPASPQESSDLPSSASSQQSDLSCPASPHQSSDLSCSTSPQQQSALPCPVSPSLFPDMMELEPITMVEVDTILDDLVAEICPISPVLQPASPQQSSDLPSSASSQQSDLSCPASPQQSDLSCPASSKQSDLSYPSSPHQSSDLSCSTSPQQQSVLPCPASPQQIFNQSCPVSPLLFPDMELVPMDVAEVDTLLDDLVGEFYSISPVLQVQPVESTMREVTETGAGSDLMADDWDWDIIFGETTKQFYISSPLLQPT
ncbi:hypothetical protein Pmani_034664 [Petrolisthes manimaculis]|uniref:Uncharacterized protein n=1 Tax=Petrolisthes manimaculis TaxID=1843537 RepID=A0AAE1NPL6_9EUCA|nr:hypothetical protein Pmani_034664 [Petrolisthes manimaculis]